MSVRTTADDKLDNAKTNLDEAYRNIIDFVDRNTWGSDEYSMEFKARAFEIASEIYKFNQELE